MQRRRLSTALGQPARVEPEASGPFWTVARRALPPARINPPAPPGAPELTVEKAIETVRDAGAWPADESPGQRKQITLLERRLAKLNGLLDSHEAELARLRTQETVDTGIASTYREPQGITADDEQGEAKKALMDVLFKANLKLQQGISSQTQSAD